MNQLIRKALEKGADEACVIPSSEIPINPKLAELCLEPRCADYGLAPGCPPNGLGPAGFRRLLTVYNEALVLRQWVPEQDLTSGRSDAIMKQLQSLAAAMEKEALAFGYEKARAYAGGSCKRLFCHDQPSCALLSGTGPCRFPRKARPSLSACGVDLLALLEICGWPAHFINEQNKPLPPRQAWIAAIVLLQTAARQNMEYSKAEGWSE